MKAITLRLSLKSSLTKLENQEVSELHEYPKDPVDYKEIVLDQANNTAARRLAKQPSSKHDLP